MRARRGARGALTRVGPATRNKFAQILVLLFAREFLTTWPTFFDDLIALLDQGPPLVDMFLRVTLTIDEELIARTMARTEAETAQSTALV